MIWTLNSCYSHWLCWVLASAGSRGRQHVYGPLELPHSGLEWLSLASAIRNWMWAVRGRAHPWGEANPEGDENWRQLPSGSAAGTKTPSLKKIQGCISKSSVSSDSVDRSILHSLWPALPRGVLSSGLSPRAPAFPPGPPPWNRSTRY